MNVSQTELSLQHHRAAVRRRRSGGGGEEEEHGGRAGAGMLGQREREKERED